MTQACSVLGQWFSALSSIKAQGFMRASQAAEWVKNPPDAGVIPRWGRSPGGGLGNPLQYSCLKTPTGRGAWRAAVHGMAKNQIQLKWPSTVYIWPFHMLGLFSGLTFTLYYLSPPLECTLHYKGDYVCLFQHFLTYCQTWSQRSWKKKEVNVFGAYLHLYDKHLHL